MSLRCGLLLLAALAHAPAVATEAADPIDSPQMEPDRAEYVRLSRELEQLGARNAWSGVERTYHKLRKTGIALRFEHHLLGAQAARAHGNLHAARRRLEHAHALQEDKQVIDWMYEIDSRYGRVTLACEPGKHRMQLESDASHFHPDMQRAVEFASRRISERCAFDGLLPHGSYRFGKHAFTVKGVQAVTIDLRHSEPDGRRERKRRQRARSAG